MPEPKLTREQARCLRDQVITAKEPGPVLSDFQVILDVIGVEGIETSGKYQLLPMRLIGELDPILSRPLHLDLKRPQIRSHPYLLGLNLLLRASGLGCVEGAGSKSRLFIDPEMRTRWEDLNPTERYFHLLEAWLRFGRGEMVGESRSSWCTMLTTCLQFWHLLPARGHRIDLKKPGEAHVPGLYGNLYLLALMDLFGLVEVKQPSRPVTPWRPAAIHHVPFGDAVFRRILDEELGLEDGFFDPMVESSEDGALIDPQFGAWQPAFQPYFPEWRKNLELPRNEPREGEFRFRVSLGKAWRLIAMPADASLDDLANWILDSVDFDNDHLYEFTWRNRLGSEVSAFHPEMDEGPWADQIRIGTLPLEVGQTMIFRFDFGDNWQFAVKLEDVAPPAGKARGPRIVESHGQAPPQYPDWDG